MRQLVNSYLVIDSYNDYRLEKLVTNNRAEFRIKTWRMPGYTHKKRFFIGNYNSLCVEKGRAIHFVYFRNKYFTLEKLSLFRTALNHNDVTQILKVYPSLNNFFHSCF